MLKPKTILIFSGLVLGSLLEKGYANPFDECLYDVSSMAKSFSMSAEERETLNQNIMGRLKIAFLGEEIRGISPELAQRMDEVFYREVRKRIASLTPMQLRRVEEIVTQDRSSHAFVGRRALAAVTGMEFAELHPAIVFNLNFPRQHPYRRIILIHELEHVIDLASGIDIGRNSTSMLKAEVGAAIAEYQYINAVFNLQDLEDLKRNFPVLPRNLHERANALLAFPQHTNNAPFVEGLSVQEAVARLINSDFMFKVRITLKVDQDTYVEGVVKSYKMTL